MSTSNEVRTKPRAAIGTNDFTQLLTHEANVTPEDLAKLFHDTYERLAPQFAYETRRESAVPWSQVKPQNKALMIATAAEVLLELRNQGLIVASDLADIDAKASRVR